MAQWKKGFKHENRYEWQNASGNEHCLYCRKLIGYRKQTVPLQNEGYVCRRCFLREVDTNRIYMPRERTTTGRKGF